MLLLLFEDEPGYRDKLWALRASADYEPAFTEAEPLVSVTIPTYNNFRMLGERAIPSVLAQTYENFEVVVVGDAAPDETADVVESFGDPRLSYFNRPTRGPYPDQQEALWHTAGVPPWNEAVRRSAGRWIAPLNDDDSFRPEHIEVLVRAAQEGRPEVCYGRIEQRSPDGSVEVIGDRFPPEWSHFNWQSAIYHTGLRFWEMEIGHALFGMPADWALCRRMLEPGGSLRSDRRRRRRVVPRQRVGPPGRSGHELSRPSRPSPKACAISAGTARRPTRPTA